MARRSAWPARCAPARSRVTPGWMDTCSGCEAVSLLGVIGTLSPGTSFRSADGPTIRSKSAAGALLARLRHLDLILVGATLAASIYGVIAVYSATKVKLADAGIDPHYYLVRQAIYVALGALAMIVVAAFDYHHYDHYAPLLYGGLMLALLAVMTPLGSSTLGSQRWFQLGPIQVQPSAFASLVVVVAVAAYATRGEGVMTPKRFLTAIAIMLVPMVIVVKEPDLGSGIVIGVSCLAVIAVAETRVRHLALLVLAGITGVYLVIHLGFLHAYQLQRLISFIHPNSSLQGAGYNLAQSKAAIGAGGVFGTGLFKGMQTNFSYVPSQQTDFIFSAVGEQFGFVGTSLLLVIFAAIVWRLWRAARLARDSFGRLICVGALVIVAFSVFENVGMTIGIMPIAGIPLPFVSYGGSAVLSFFAAVGLALNVQMRRLR